ncbi:MAG: hypothetical protein KIS62_01265 [Ramlibacter sp.]|nr:hypothetical protein [Ramlibacter sp.]
MKPQASNPAADDAAAPANATPRIRYLRGPASLSFVDAALKRGQWLYGVSPKLAESIMRPGHIATYGLEAEGYAPAMPPADSPTDKPAGPAGDAPAAPADESPAPQATAPAAPPPAAGKPRTAKAPKAPKPRLSA